MIENLSASAARSVNFFGDVQEDANPGQGEEEAGAAGGDEGQWDSLGGEEREHHADVEEGLKEDRGCESEGGEARKRICGAEGGAEAAVSEDAEEDEDGHGAEEAELFSDVGVDEVGLRFGKIEELLHALHVAAAHEASGADGDEGLVDVESGALGVEVGVHEGEHAGATPGDPEKKYSETGRGGGDGEGEIFPVHAGEEQQHGGDSGDDERGAEVGLLDDEQHERDGHERGFEQRVAPVLHLVEARGEEPGEKENDDGLGDFRWLKGEASETDPAMGVVRVAKEEDSDEENGGDGERGEDEAGRVVAGVVDAGEDEHGADAGEGPCGLASDEGVGGIETSLRGDGGGGKDHDEADDHEEKRGEEDPFVDAYALGHWVLNLCRG